MSGTKELIKQYFELQGQIHEWFGYVEDWVTIPMDDNDKEQKDPALAEAYKANWG